MGTHLTNDKMHPDLRARIEASVRAGRPAAARAPMAAAQPLRMGLRLVAATVIVGCMLALGQQWKQGREQLDEARAQLAAEHRSGAVDLETLPRRAAAVEALITQAASAYEGDFVHPSLREARGLDGFLEQPLLYVRGPLVELRSRAKVRSAVAAAGKDSFLSCLAAPPRSTAEKDLLPTVAATYRGVPPPATRFMHRVQELFAAEPVLDPAWADELAAAASVAELQALRQELERAHLKWASNALKADRLLYVIDEPTKTGTFAEVDGASDHLVRVGLVDLGTREHLLRLRQRIEPSWISEGRRVHFARGLNGCRFALDLRKALGPLPAVGTSAPVVQASR